MMLSRHRPMLIAYYYQYNIKYKQPNKSNENISKHKDDAVDARNQNATINEKSVCKI